MEQVEALKLKQITAPASEPVTLAEVKAQLRIDADDTDMDDTLTPILTAAREWCEEYQNRAYITQTWEIALDDFPYEPIQLPRPPLQSVSSFKYTDYEDTETTWAASNYIVDDYSEPAEITRAYDVSWPTVTLKPTNAIKIRYVTGYGAADDVPEKIKQAIILLTMHWFDHGYCEPPAAVIGLLGQNRVVPT